MIQSPSFLELFTKRSSAMLKFVSTSQVLQSSRGRDKVLAFMQYSAKLYKECMSDYLSSKRIREWPISVRNSKGLNGSMKTGRKLFRLFRWLEEIPTILNIPFG